MKIEQFILCIKQTDRERERERERERDLVLGNEHSRACSNIT